MSSIFTKIVNGEIPCHKIAETDRYLAFLDIRPMAKGHTLAIPKKETDYLFDLEEEELAGLMVFSKRVSKALEKTISCKRVGVLVVGTEVPHAHVHLIPFQTESQMNLSGKKLEMSHEQLAELSAAVRNHFQ